MLTVTSLMLRMYHDQSSFYHLLLSIKEFYELASIPNQVQDGTERFPSSVKPGEGVSVRFENVSFRYPGSDSFALKNVNFDIKAGGLCVIVGMNGEGKSSILKLLPRLFDPTEGTIYLDNLPINRYRLLDLRKSLNVLFQDFQTFPMTIKEGIRLGSNTIEYEDEQVREALKLGGAEGFVNELPMKEDTNLSHLRQYFSFSGPEANDIFYAIPEDIRLSSKDTRTNLSGGQKQRLALSRTFMRKPEEVSLLVYDEPSAALDPQAEFDLFERLRVLKGNKTMIFSTHRFGYLTRYADIILFMKDSTIAEAGTHQELMSIPDGGYAKLYTLQAQAFS
ncbi:P-loop containing nucleoside triphosphate hydrolase protein, partial [Cantharellus anzutake]|uniref:P-loop containing nucleoside triphosphate hydrolase protein n=1 Tax=Cantharellus anzutake TaxID=1750568 RepID=UPI001903DD84